ncbi:hypothetical protein N7516_009936 [Penicillium verrucosum]|nr:uncharacterized protein N7516_009936 [Penicillium verrucosum]KAJ5922233.1 hypothetical protein N7516_009936 [Penicillium verrucosum]
MPIYEGDFLGIFAGTIRFSEDFNVIYERRNLLA